MRVDIFFVEDCPNSEPARQLMEGALRSERATAEVRMIEVRDEQDALARRFLGSPTVQIEGVDVESAARSRRDFGLMCRTYRSASGVAGVPSMTMLIEAIRASAPRF